MPISIDDSLEAAREHLVKHGWTNTFNVWAGSGGWQSAAAKAFRVTELPICYVIDSRGVIAGAGLTPLLDTPEMVNGMLK